MPPPPLTRRCAVPVLAAFILGAYAFLFPVRQPDYFAYLLPWLDAVTRPGAFSDGFSNYTGGYLGVLWLTGLGRDALGDLGAIKLAAVIGTVFCAVGVHAVLRAVGWRGRDAARGMLVFMAAPTVMLNGIGWGQADAFYTGFLLFTVAAAIDGRPHRVALLFCLAFAFKMQAMFAAPLVAGYLLRPGNRAAILTGFAAVLPCYLLVNAPFLLAGRPLSDVLTIYAGQVSHFRALSLAAPNMWMMVQAVEPAPGAFYGPGLVIGLGLGAATGGLVAFGVARARELTTGALLHAGAACLIAMPYVLPKMHERFFYPAEALLIVCALVDRRFVVPALTIQLAGVLSYSAYHDTLGMRAALGGPVADASALVAMTMTLWVVAVRPWLASRDQPASSCGSIGATVCAPAVTAGARPAARGSRFSA